MALPKATRVTVLALGENFPLIPAHRHRPLSAQQGKSGIAAWLGWMFDGLDMHLYTLVAAPFVAQLTGATSTAEPAVANYASIIQAAFLLGWGRWAAASSAASATALAARGR